MCGIFGAIGNNINLGIIRALTLANRERGVDSLGFFNSTGKYVKCAGDPLDCLADPKINTFIELSTKAWFLAGHTRQATQGAITTRNAHPFRYGRYIGCHNGIVYAPKQYEVDSEFLIDSLNCWKGDYQQAFADIDGYWSLAWFDGQDFFLQAHDNEIWLGKDRRGTWYYSSDGYHLDVCVGKMDFVRCLRGGQTISFNVKSRKYKNCRRFKATPYWFDVETVETKSDPSCIDDRWGQLSVWEEYTN